MSLRWKAVKGHADKNPLFLPKSGFFIDRAFMMNGTRNLKLFVSISLGLHLSVFSLLSILLPDLKIIKLPHFNIEVSLLSPEKGEKERIKKVDDAQKVRGLEFAPIESGQGVRNKEEEPLKIVEKKEAEITSQSLPVNIEATKIPRIEKLEVASSIKEQAPMVTSTVQTEVKMVSISEPTPFLLKSEREEVEGKQVERIVVASLGHTVPPTGSAEKHHLTMKSPSLSESEIIFAQPRYAENPKPLYPREAKKKGYEGEVLLRIEVLSNGRVGTIEVKRSSGHELLDRSAMTAVKQWTFIPARKGETPVPVWVHIPIAFQLR